MPGAAHSVVYLHIGAFKSGTTYVQAVLWENRGRLAEDGVLVPGREPWDQSRAARDALNLNRWGYADSSTVGAWDRMVSEIGDWTAGPAIVSAETLGGASRAQIAAMVASLAPRQVRVVLTARDLARVIPASWQTLTRNGHAWTWTEFLDAIADPMAATQPPARGFWRKQDLPGILARWSSAVPIELVQIVPVPKPGSAPLWERFASAVEVDATRYDADVSDANPSLGAASAELLRRLNPTLMARVPWSVYQPAVTLHLGKNVLGQRSEPRIGFDHRRLPWVRQRAEQMVAELRSSGYAVRGDLDDLVPADDGAVEGVSPDTVSDAQLLDAAMAAIVGLVERTGETPAEAESTELAEQRISDVTAGMEALRAERNQLRRQVNRLQRARTSAVSHDD